MDAALSRFARLSELFAVLADALSEEDVVAAVLEQGLEVLGCSGGFVSLAAPDGSELRLVGQRGHADEVAQRWNRIPLDARVPAAAAYRSGERIVVGTIEERDLHFPDLTGPMEERVSVTVPLRGRGGVLGAIGFSYAAGGLGDAAGPAMSEQDSAYTDALADHCAAAIERSRLFAESAAARAAAERSADRATLLQDVTSDLAQARTARRVAEVLVHKGVGAAEGQAGWVSLLNREGTMLELAAEAGFPTATVDRFRLLDLAGDEAPVRWLHGGVPLWLESAEAVGAAYPEIEETHRASGLEAVAVLPLVVQGRSVGFLAIDFTAPRTFDADERALLETLAKLCSQALERVRLYEELGSRANAAAVLERIGEGVFQLDSFGRILIWNPAAAAITGIPADQAIGRRIDQVLPGWQRLAASRDAASFALGGRELWLSFSTVEYPEGAVYAFRDLTEERALEEARRDFVATASHELRTPLSAVYGAARTLQKRTLAEERRVELISLIESESARLAAILDELLLASRLDARALTLQPVPCDAGRLVREVVELARERVPEGVELHLGAGVAAGADAIGCLADPDRLRQVLVNLVDNAIKYSPGGGRVDVAVGAAAGGAVRIVVADRGLGIPAAERDRIFEKFYRLDPSLTRGVGGTGLGLYICRQLVQGMGGRIGVDGRDGDGGSLFWVELPGATLG